MKRKQSGGKVDGAKSEGSEQTGDAGGEEGLAVEQVNLFRILPTCGRGSVLRMKESLHMCTLAIVYIENVAWRLQSI